MTLILGAGTDQQVVVASDGLEMKLNVAGERTVATESQRKMVLVPRRTMAIAVAGQNRIVPLGREPGEAETQDMLVDRFATLEPRKQTRRIYDIAKLAANRVAPEIAHTFQSLAKKGLQADFMHVVFIGFDPLTKGLQLYEAKWFPDGRATGVQSIAHRKVSVVHFGSGGPVAKALVATTPAWHPDRLVEASRTLLQKTVHEIYSACTSSSGAQLSFGGKYQEVTLDRFGTAAWTTPAASD